MPYPDDSEYLDLFRKFIKKEIKLNKYLKERDLIESTKLNKLREVVQIINEKPKSFDLYLSEVTIGVRCLAMLAVLELTHQQIEENIPYERTMIGDFIRENLIVNENPDVISQRNFSAEFIRKLSIIFDLPYRYLNDPLADSKLFNTFEEYARTIIKLSTLQELIEEILMTMREENIKRKIFGSKIKNNFLETANVLYFYIRVDIRKEFFTVEVYLENSVYIKYNTVKIIEVLFRKLGVNGEIYYRDAFLRENRKLIILIWSGNSKTPSVPYLRESLLLNNQIF